MHRQQTTDTLLFWHFVSTKAERTPSPHDMDRQGLPSPQPHLITNPSPAHRGIQYPCYLAN